MHKINQKEMAASRRNLFLAFGVSAVLLGMMFSLPAAAQTKTAAAKSFGSAKSSASTTKDITVSGWAQSFQKAPVGKGLQGYQLTLASDKSIYETSLGEQIPASVNSALTEGAQVKITGFLRTVNNRQVLYAKSITVGGQTLTVRNDKGFLVRTKSSLAASQSSKNHGKAGGAL